MENNIINKLRDLVNKNRMVDVGVGASRDLCITEEKLDKAIEILKTEGYVVWGVKLPKASDKEIFTTIKMLCVPGTEYKDIFTNGKTKRSGKYPFGTFDE